MQIHSWGAMYDTLRYTPEEGLRDRATKQACFAKNAARKATCKRSHADDEGDAEAGIERT